MMAPGTYLERRRIAAGYSLPGLARELLALQGFGTARSLSNLHRLHLALLSAEQGTLHHTRARIETIRAFVPLDVSLYLHLVECERSGDPCRADGICDVCACTFHDPCVLDVGPAAVLGQGTCHWAAPNLCSVCADALGGITPDAFRAIGRDGPSITEQLRELGERMRAIATREDVRAAADGIETLATNLGQPPCLRLVPNTGEN